MYEVNTVPKPDEGLNISKLVIQLNSVSDEPWRIQYSITGFGKDNEGAFFPNPLYSSLYVIEGENWSNWTPEAAGSDSEYVTNLVLNYVGLEKAPEEAAPEESE